jgi:recombination protein RecT
MTISPTTSVTTPKAEPKTFRELITSDGYKNQLAAALPKGLSADRMVRVVLTAINKNPDLLKCTKESLWEAVMGCSALGLFPDMLGRAYLVPYGNKCTLIIGYKGLIDLAYRSERIDGVQLRPVFQGDYFVYRFGLEPQLEHEPCSEPGQLTHVYSVVHIKGAANPTFDVMRRDEVEAIRARSKAGNNGPWKTDYAAMAMKTVLRRHAKLLPMSAEMVQALEMDGDGIDLTASVNTSADRMKDDFGAEKQTEGTVVADAVLTAAIKDATAMGVPSDTILEVLGKAGGSLAGSIEERAAKVPADKLATCLSDLSVVTRVYADGVTK